MAPVKFDDIHKVANDILNDDYVAGYQLKAKQKTSWDGAVVTSAVDLFPDKAGKDGNTPAKLTWKIPKPFGLTSFAVDKLEMDKAGKFKFEASSDKVQVPGVKVELKSDLANVDKLTASATYTAVKDLQVKFETKLTNPGDFGVEVTKEQPCLGTVGLKCSANNLAAPDLGLRRHQGPLFCSLLVKEKFSVFTAHGSYKATDDIPLAGTYEHGGKKSGSFTFGLLYNVMKGVTVKAKVSQDQALHFGVKSEVTKGFNVLFGGKFETSSGDFKHGLHLQIE
jgi:hypothetical protein